MAEGWSTQATMRLSPQFLKSRWNAISASEPGESGIAIFSSTCLAVGGKVFQYCRTGHAPAMIRSGNGSCSSKVAEKVLCRSRNLRDHVVVGQRPLRLLLF